MRFDKMLGYFLLALTMSRVLEIIDAAFHEWPGICRLIVTIIHWYIRQVAAEMIDEAERAARQQPPTPPE